MKILIIGEFSAFAKHLKNGFKKLGHDVCIVQNGDGWKKISYDVDDIHYQFSSWHLFGRQIPGTVRISYPRINRYIQQRLEERFPVGPDLIVVTNYEFISNSSYSAGVKLKYLESCLQKGAKLIMMVCGGDPSQYYAFPEYYKMLGIKKSLFDKRYDFLLRHANNIVPTIYSYYYSVKLYCEKFGYPEAHVGHAIPLPMTLEKYEIHPCTENKIVVFHGVNRPISKGTPLIKRAMDRIQQDYPDRVQCICKGGIPYDEYVKLFDNVDILIDQTYHNGWGVNAAIGAMKGKCILAPCGPENCENMGISNIPFVRIGPNSDQIYDTLKSLILNPEKIDLLKKESREFIEQYCECSIVARQYLQSVGL